jgi:glycosyltransferase involved in cell wall biosynthesis
VSDAVDVVLVCGAGNVSGKEIVALTLARGLERRGRSVNVFTSIWNDGDFPKRLTKAHIGKTFLPLGFISATLRWDCIWMTADQLWRWPILLWKYSRALRRLRPRKVVHTNWHHVLLLWPLLNSRRDILWLHEVIPGVGRYERLFRGLAGRVHSFAAVSHAVAESLARSGVPPEKITVIHNGIVPLRSGRGSVEARRNGVRLGIVGQIGAWKGHDDLLEALGLLAQKGRPPRLTIFGKGADPYVEHLKARVADLGLQELVSWAGFVQDRTAIYASIDICVIPSRFEEPFATTALEAGSCGIPVIATTRGGLPEIVEDGVTGFLVPPHAPQYLAAAIDRLAADAQLRARMGRNGGERIRHSFSEDRFLSSFEQELFREGTTS